MVKEPSREQLERILDAVPDRIFLLDHNFRVQYRNLAAGRGLPLIEVGMHVDEVYVPPGHRDGWRSALQRALVSGIADRLELDGVAGSRRVDVSLVPLQQGDAPSVAVIMRDLTESPGTLARGIAHDLNNILMSIQMSCEILRRTGGPPNVEQAIDRIAASTRRGADLVSQLRSFPS